MYDLIMRMIDIGNMADAEGACEFGECNYHGLKVSKCDWKADVWEPDFIGWSCDRCGRRKSLANKKIVDRE